MKIAISNYIKIRYDLLLFYIHILFSNNNRFQKKFTSNSHEKLIYNNTTYASLDDQPPQTKCAVFPREGTRKRIIFDYGYRYF